MSDKIPCEHQDADTWVCAFGPYKPEGKCRPHTLQHRAMHRANAMRRSSILCMITPPLCRCGVPVEQEGLECPDCHHGFEADKLGDV